MPYIQGEIHFANYIRKAVKTNNILISDLYPIEYYIHYIFNTGKADKLSWEIKINPFILKKENIKQFLLLELGLSSFLKAHNLCFDETFLRTIYSFDFPGVYMFTKNEESLYIGSSKEIRKRVLTSFRQNISSNIRKKTEKIDLSIIRTTNEVDARFLELYYIGKLKPKNNSYGVIGGPLTLEIVNPPIFENIIKIEYYYSPYGENEQKIISINETKISEDYPIFKKKYNW